MQTFDFYDTLVIRLVANPGDIFELVGQRIGSPDFRMARIEAERQARIVRRGEITIDDIYAQMPDDETKHAARTLELEFEATLLVLIAENAGRFRDGDVIISDMYLYPSHFSNVLARLMPDRHPGHILVSGEMGASKARGDLWKALKSRFPQHHGHIGDNHHSDVRQARRHGFRASHYTSARLNRYEAKLAAAGLDGSLFAGASRAARLSLTGVDTTSSDRAVIDAFTSVFGPMLICFCEWVLAGCVAEGVTKAYFLARDGQLPLKICTKLAAARGLAIEFHYLHGSRQALHVPGLRGIDQAESWLLDDTLQLTLRVLAERAQVPLEYVLQAAADRLEPVPDLNITADRRPRLREVVREPTFLRALQDATDAALPPALAYYAAAGLTTPAPIALIDIGWNGRMQASLRGLLDKAPDAPQRILGLYLCLSRRFDQDPRDSLRGFLFEPPPGGCGVKPLYDAYRHVFEAALSADHPTTVGFTYTSEGSAPIFGRPLSESQLRRIRLQHAAVELLMDNLLALETTAARPIVAPTDVMHANLTAFLRTPTNHDGQAFVDFAFSEAQVENEGDYVSRIVSVWDAIRRGRRLGFWPEGTLSASRLGGLSALRKLRSKLIRRLRDRKG